MASDDGDGAVFIIRFFYRWIAVGFGIAEAGGKTFRRQRDFTGDKISGIGSAVTAVFMRSDSSGGGTKEKRGFAGGGDFFFDIDPSDWS